MNESNCTIYSGENKAEQSGTDSLAKSQCTCRCSNQIFIFLIFKKKTVNLFVQPVLGRDRDCCDLFLLYEKETKFEEEIQSSTCWQISNA